MKIAHISDLHLDNHLKRSNISDTVKVLEYISDNNFDHVIITGDITDRAVPSAFETARNIFKRFGFLKPEKLTLTIGNHDIFGGVHFAEDVIEFPARCKNTNYNDKIKEFESYFHECLEKTMKRNNNTFPFIKEFDDFVLCGINSIAEYSVLKNPFASNGKISSSQLSVLNGLLDEGGLNSKRKIALTHHHFYKEEAATPGTIWQTIERQTMKLKGKKKVLNAFSDIGIELVLHGHLHEVSEYSRKGIKIVNGGGSILAKEKKHYSINSLEVSSTEIKTQVLEVPRSLVSYPHEFEPNTHKYSPQKTLADSFCMN